MNDSADRSIFPVSRSSGILYTLTFDITGHALDFSTFNRSLLTFTVEKRKSFHGDVWEYPIVMMNDMAIAYRQLESDLATDKVTGKMRLPIMIAP